MNGRSLRKIKKTWPVKNEILELAKTIEAVGGRAYLVGGYVRDCLWQEITGRVIVGEIDYDIEVFGLDQARLEQVLKKQYPDTKIDQMGKSFGVYKIFLGDRILEVSLPRIEKKVAPTHQGFVVEIVTNLDLKQAAKRRDFTINAMMYDPITHKLFDFFSGQEDLKQKILRPVSTQTFLDDPLRLWRAVQLAGRFELKINWVLVYLAKFILKYQKLEEVPKERVTQELTKLFLLSQRPSFGLKAARKLGLVKTYLSEVGDLYKIKQHTLWHPEGSAWNHTLQVIDAAVEITNRENIIGQRKLMLILAGLVHDLGKAVATKYINGQWHAHGHEKYSGELARKLLNRFSFKKDLSRAVVSLAKNHMIPEHIWRRAKQQKNLNQDLLKIAYHLQKEGLSWPDLIFLAESDQRGRNGDSETPLNREQSFELVEWESWLRLKLLDLSINQTAVARLVGGQDLLTVIPETFGVWTGVLLRCLYLDQLAQKFTSCNEGLILAKKYWNQAEKNRQKLGLEQKQFWQNLRNISDPRSRLV